MNDTARATWTAKLPTLIAGVVLASVGFFVLLYGKSRTAFYAGLILLVAGAGFIGYSMTIKEWCVVNTKSAFSSGFSPSLRGCLRIKGWLEF